MHEKVEPLEEDTTMALAWRVNLDLTLCLPSDLPSLDLRLEYFWKANTQSLIINHVEDNSDWNYTDKKNVSMQTFSIQAVLSQSGRAIYSKKSFSFNQPF